MVEFYLCESDSCASCQTVMQSAVLIAKDYGIKLSYISDLVKIDELASSYHLERLPALLLMKDGIFQGVVYGYQPYEILAYWVEGYLN